MGELISISQKELESLDDVWLPKEPYAYPVFNLMRKGYGAENKHEVTLAFEGGYFRMTNREQGLPGEFDFRVYLTLSYYSNVIWQRNKYKGFPSKMTFTLAELRENMGMTNCGENNQLLMKSLRRLRNTNCETNVKTSKRRLMSSFSLIYRCEIEKMGGEWMCDIQIPDEFVFDHPTWITQSTNESIKIEGIVRHRLYHEASKIFYTKIKGYFVKSLKNGQPRPTLKYDTILEKYFVGFTRHEYLSKVEQQLCPYFNDLCQAGLIHGYEIMKSEAKDANQFIIQFELKPVRKKAAIAPVAAPMKLNPKPREKVKSERRKGESFTEYHDRMSGGGENGI